MAEIVLEYFSKNVCHLCWKKLPKFEMDFSLKESLMDGTPEWSWPFFQWLPGKRTGKAIKPTLSVRFLEAQKSPLFSSDAIHKTPARENKSFMELEKKTQGCSKNQFRFGENVQKTTRSLKFSSFGLHWFPFSSRRTEVEIFSRETHFCVLLLLPPSSSKRPFLCARKSVAG